MQFIFSIFVAFLQILNCDLGHFDVVYLLGNELIQFLHESNGDVLTCCLRIGFASSIVSTQV